MFLVVLIAFWLLAVAGWWLWKSMFRTSDADRFKHRLLGTSKQAKEKSSGPLLIRSQATSGPLFRLMRRFRLQESLRHLLEQAGSKWTPAQLMQRCLLMAAVGFVAGWFFIPADFKRFAVAPSLAAFFFPIARIVRTRTVRLRRFEELFPDSLEFMSRSMRAGHAFSVSLEMIHREFQEPLAGEFKRTFEEHNLGIPMDLALQKLAVRVPSLDVHFFVSAVLLQKRTGGNLAEILDKLAFIIRERFKLRGKIRAISAHGRMTGLALTLIPLGVGVIMFYVNPDYVRFFFTDPTGNKMLAAAAGFQLLGYAIIQKIVKIEV